MRGHWEEEMSVFLLSVLILLLTVSGEAPRISSSAPTGLKFRGGGVKKVNLGDSVRFICSFSPGQSSKRIRWLKNGDPVDSTWSRFRTSGRTLRISKVEYKDAGIYQCILPQSRNLVFRLIVNDDKAASAVDPGVPRISAGLPGDVKMKPGNEAVFECLVESPDKYLKSLRRPLKSLGANVLTPHIKWLKRVEGHELHKSEYKDRLLPVDNGLRHVVVLQEKDSPENWIHVEDKWIGSSGTGMLILSRLRLGPVTPEKARTYICLATNNVGYNYHEARLEVNPMSANFTDGQMSRIGFPVLVLGISLLLGIFAVTAACALRRYQKRQDRKAKNVSLPSSLVQEKGAGVPLSVTNRVAESSPYLMEQGGCWCAHEDMYSTSSAMSFSTLRSSSDHEFCTGPCCPSSTHSQW